MSSMTLWLPAAALICATVPAQAGPAPPAMIEFDIVVLVAAAAAVAWLRPPPCTSAAIVTKLSKSRPALKTLPPAVARLPLTVEFVSVAEPPAM